MADYQLITNSTAVLRRSDSATIPNDPANKDRYEYEQWLAAGNVADPPDKPTVVQQSVSVTDAPGATEYSPEQELAMRQEKPP